MRRLTMDIVGMIRKNQLLFYIGKCLMYIRDEEFRSKVIALTTPEMAQFQHNGDAYPGKIVYYYKSTWTRNFGLFGALNDVLGGINYADQLGMLPVVEWDRTSPYCDESMDSVTMNPFEYYFKQPAGVSLEEVSFASNLVLGKMKDSQFVRPGWGGRIVYGWNIERFKELAVIMRKYIRLTDDVQKDIVTDIKKCGITERTLGVHVRRISFQYGAKDHPVPVELDDFLTTVNKLMSTGAYDKIFLATEEEESLTAMINQFGEKIVYYKDVIRNNIGDTMFSAISDRPQHHFLMGYEALRDVCTLAMCKSLVAGISNMSMNAKIMKLSMDGDYTEEVILDNGLRDKGFTLKKVQKKIRKRAKSQA